MKKLVSFEECLRCAGTMSKNDVCSPVGISSCRWRNHRLTLRRHHSLLCPCLLYPSPEKESLYNHYFKQSPFSVTSFSVVSIFWKRKFIRSLLQSHHSLSHLSLLSPSLDRQSLYDPYFTVIIPCHVFLCCLHLLTEKVDMILTSQSSFPVTSFSVVSISWQRKFIRSYT